VKSVSFHTAIASYIKSQTALTFATSVDGAPYCANCYYALCEKHPALIFKSEKNTQHIIEALKNKKVAGTILPDKLIHGKVQGIQFTGVFVEPDGEVLEDARKAYYGRFPFAVAFKGQLWMVELQTVKFTDNALGFGAKLKWEKETTAESI
jgi:uncharacterized protein